jgi:hypothetical protein
MAAKVILVGLAALLMASAAPTQAQRRGETMKVTAADDRKATVTPTDEGFVRGASGAYQMGSKLAMIAATRATDPATKALGTSLVKDFMALGTQLKPAASGEKGYQWSHEPSPDDQKTLDAFDRLSDTDRDAALPTQLVALMERVRAVFTAEAEKGRDPDLKPLAEHASGWIDERLTQAKALHAAK